MRGSGSRTRGRVRDGPKNMAERGRAGEDAAADHLRRCGYRIVARNYAWRGGEIDIIASEGPVLAFVEVKARRGRRFGAAPGHEAIDWRKQQRVAQTAQHYLAKKQLGSRACRFDVVVIQDDRIELIRNAFELPSTRSGV